MQDKVVTVSSALQIRGEGGRTLGWGPRWALMLSSRPFLLHSRCFSFSSRNAPLSGSHSPGKSLDTSSTFLGLPHTTDELQKKAGRNGVPGEAPGTGESWISGRAGSHVSESLRCPLHAGGGSPGISGEQEVGGHLGCRIWPPAAFRAPLFTNPLFSSWF